MKKEFIAFLVRHRAYKKFMRNLKNSYPKETLPHHIEECNEAGARYIGGAFGWSETPEGYKYWFNLSILWETEKKLLVEQQGTIS